MHQSFRDSNVCPEKKSFFLLAKHKSIIAWKLVKRDTNTQCEREIRSSVPCNMETEHTRIANIKAGHTSAAVKRKGNKKRQWWGGGAPERDDEAKDKGFAAVKNFLSLSFVSPPRALHRIFYITALQEIEGAAQGKRESNQSEDDDSILSRFLLSFRRRRKSWVLGGLPNAVTEAMPRKVFCSIPCRFIPFQNKPWGCAIF